MSDIVIGSVLTCPNCQVSTEAEMPEDACQFFWQCPSCQALIKPLEGDCCVFCSYGTVPCPPVQKDGKAGCC